MTNLERLDKKGINGVAFDIAPLVRELRAYGEDAGADFLAEANEETHDRISELALTYVVQKGFTIDKAVCLATIEVIDGSPRELKRKRRSFKGI